MRHVRWETEGTANYYRRQASWAVGSSLSRRLSKKMAGQEPYEVAEAFRTTSGEGKLSKAFV